MGSFNNILQEFFGFQGFLTNFWRFGEQRFDEIPLDESICM